MSRTKRTKASKYKVFRDPKTKNTRTAEHYAASEIEQDGFKVSNRLKGRANPVSGKIPSDWDDLNISAFREQDYRKGKGLK